LKIIRSKF